MFTRRTAYAPRERYARDVESHVDKALDGDLEHVQRVKALWSLAHLPAFTDVGGRTLAGAVGSLLDHPSALIAREAFEVLCTSLLPSDEVSRMPELSLAVGMRSGRIVVSPRTFERCERVAPFRAWCPDLDVEVRPLIDVAQLLDAQAGHGLRAATSKLRHALVLRPPRMRRLSERGPSVLRNARDADGAPRLEGAADDAWTLEGSFVLDDVRSTSAVITAHHHIVWPSGEADVVVVPAIGAAQRILVDAPEGGLDALHEGDAWFSPLQHGKGHLALRATNVIVVDTTANEPRVINLQPRESTTFGSYGVEFHEDGKLVRIEALRADGPTRNSARAAATKSAGAKKVA